MSCTWEPDFGCSLDKWEAFDPEVQERALILATGALQLLTYNRVGACPITIRPCPPTPRCGCRVAFQPNLGVDGQWRNQPPCGHPCAPLSEYEIPGPVGYIESLKIDGEEIDLHDGNWRLDNGHLLVWQGSGPSPLPDYQDLNKPDTEVGTWSLTYSQSYPVTATGRIALGALAIEMARACSPSTKCSLPKGVQSVVRRGISMTIDSGLFIGGLTGLETADVFILQWAPAGSPLRAPVVFSPRSGASAPRRTSRIPMAPTPGSE